MGKKKEKSKFFLNMPRAKHWIVVVNNPNDDDRSVFASEAFKNKVTYYIYQIERGSSGTPHIQAYISFQRQVRETTVKAFFPRCHMEVARGSPEQNKTYCSKEEGRVEGPFEHGSLPEGQGTRNDLKEFRECVMREPLSEIQVYNRFPQIAARYRDFVRVSIEHGRESRRLETLPAFNPRPGWQAGLKAKLDLAANSRTVMWYWEDVGNTGKSFFALNYRDPQGGFGYVVTGGRHADIYAGFRDEKIIFFDWARDNEENFPYRVIENFKNGYFLSTKYQVCAKRFEPVHVVVFANFPPDQSKLSRDRWDIVNILDEIIS